MPPASRRNWLRKQFVLEADDHRIITYIIPDRMKTLKGDKDAELTSFGTGDHLTVDSVVDDEGYFTALTVTFSSTASPEDRSLAARTFDLPDLKTRNSAPSAKSSGDDAPPTMRRPGSSATEDKKEADKDDADNRPKTEIRRNDPAPDADDPGKPRVRRGPPPVTARKTDDDDRADAPPVQVATNSARVNTTPAPPPDAIPISEDPVIVKAKEAAVEFSGRLPNFLVKESITRYDSQNPKAGWDAHDIVTADVTYEKGTQVYKNIKVGSRSVKSMADTGGEWSTGEFATWVDDVFDPTTAARFRRANQEMIHGRPSFAFKYEVTREHSHWRVNTAAQLYYPAFRGTIWIDKESSRVLRLEVEARGIPLLFPLDKVEMAMDYDFVKLASPRPFLLPTGAEVLSCQQGTTFCSRNKIEFRNYRRFGADSDIVFEDQQ